MKVELIAIHEIQTREEGATAVTVHAPGSKFVSDEANAERLLSLGAAKLYEKTKPAKAEAAEESGDDQKSDDQKPSETKAAGGKGGEKKAGDKKSAAKKDLLG
jgi:hypothetical protein